MLYKIFLIVTGNVFFNYHNFEYHTNFIKFAPVLRSNRNKIMFNLSIDTSFSAAHLLRDYDGPCSRTHGHNWKIRVEVLADTLDEKGIAIDFKDLKNLTWQVIGKFDHSNFNDIAPFDTLNPTAENIVKYFFDELKKILPEGTRLNKIRLWETEKYAVEYSE